MNPLKGYYFPESGKVESGDYVCNLFTPWEPADGLRGSKFHNGFIMDTFYKDGGWRVCRPLKKKRA